ncbi:3-hydroxyacyl-CoA dehydrogenase family protein [Halopseudomonas pachastrellae]|nr:3-hydroxyacyl-CoA dehydrogenase family protein [Halopseudomonas pachastrellae]
MTQCIRQLAGSEDLQAALDRLIFDPEHHGAALADALIDAQTGDLEARRAKLARLEPQMRPQALLLSLHAALEPQRSALGDAGRLLGVRFAGPVQRGALAELASHSTGRTISQQHARQLLGQLGCLPVAVSSQPGLLLRRVLAPMLLEALLLLEEGHETSAIDQAALDFGFDKGPLALLMMTGAWPTACSCSSNCTPSATRHRSSRQRCCATGWNRVVSVSVRVRRGAGRYQGASSHACPPKKATACCWPCSTARCVPAARASWPTMKCSTLP